jgi:hypothetical protein
MECAKNCNQCNKDLEMKALWNYKPEVKRLTDEEFNTLMRNWDSAIRLDMKMLDEIKKHNL